MNETAGTLTAGFEAVINSSNGWVHGLRERGMREFVRQGLPTKKLESWRYTDIGSLDAGEPLTLAATPKLAGVPVAGRAAALGLVDLPATEVTLTDGFFAPDSELELERGVMVSSLARAMETHPYLVEPHLAQSPQVEGGAFAALNTAFLRDGLFIYVPTGVQLAAPIHVRYLASAGDGSISHPRCLVVAGAGAAIDLIESFGGASGGYLVNPVTEVVLAAGAQVRHARFLQDDPRATHIGQLDIRLAGASAYRGFQLGLGARLSRTSTSVLFQDIDGSATLTALNVTQDQQHVDNFSLVDHAVPGCQSQQLTKNILAGESSTVFNAKVRVRREAQRSDARQHNRNLILSRGAVANTKPQLEIDADDVSCAHGATVGQLDPEQIFYLRSRGLDPEQARRELTLGFARSVIDTIEPSGLRGAVERLVRDRLARLDRRANTEARN